MAFNQPRLPLSVGRYTLLCNMATGQGGNGNLVYASLTHQWHFDQSRLPLSIAPLTSLCDGVTGQGGNDNLGTKKQTGHQGLERGNLALVSHLSIFPYHTHTDSAILSCISATICQSQCLSKRWYGCGHQGLQCGNLALVNNIDSLAIHVLLS